MSLIEDRQSGVKAATGAPASLTAGAAATGEFRCAACGYGVAVRARLPVCPMCRGVVWDDPVAPPYGRPRL